MDVQGVFKLFWKGLYFQLFLNQLILVRIDFIFENWNLCALSHQNLQLSLEVSLFVVQQFQIGHSFPEGSFSSGQSCLLDFYLLIQESRFVISSDQLSPKDIPLCQNQLVFIFFVLSFSLELFDAGMQLRYLIRKVLDDLSLSIHFLFLLLKFSAVFKQGLIFLLMFEVFLGQGYFFGLNFFFELVDLMVDYLVSSLYLGNLVLSLGQLLGVTVSGRSDRLIKFLLLFESTFSLNVLLLVLADEVALKFDFFKRLLILRVGQGCLLSVHLFKFLNF